MIQEGKKAPGFSLESSEGGTVRLEDLRGKPVVLYFYPKDDTPGCTREACAFRDQKAALKKRGAVVLGVSGDSVDEPREVQGEVQAELPAALRSRQGGGEEVRGLGREGALRPENRGHDPLHLRDRRGGSRAQGLPAGEGGRPRRAGPGRARRALEPGRCA